MKLYLLFLCLGNLIVVAAQQTNLRGLTVEDGITDVHEDDADFLIHSDWGYPYKIEQNVVVGEGHDWKRMYARAMVRGDCPTDGNIIPMFENGYAAGPRLCPPDYNAHGAPHLNWCSKSVDELDTSQMLAAGEAIKFELDDATSGVRKYFASAAKDRERQSSSSGVVWLGENHFVVVSFGHSTVYLFHIDQEMKVTLLDECLNKSPKSTVNHGQGRKGEMMELVDYDGHGLLATGNYHTASFTIFEVDWYTKKLHLLQGTYPFEDRGCKQYTHGVRFYPSNKGSHIVAQTTNHKKCTSSLGVTFYDWHRNETRAELRSADTPYHHMGAQDVWFIDKFNMLVAFTPDKVSMRLKKGECRSMLPASMLSVVVHYRLDFDLDDDSSIEQPKRFIELQSISYNNSHPDSISYNDGIMIISDQYNDQVNFVAVDPTGQKKMKHLDILTGYHMNHGVALAPSFEKMAVTQYGDNSVIVNKIPQRIRDVIAPYRLSRDESQKEDYYDYFFSLKNW